MHSLQYTSFHARWKQLAGYFQKPFAKPDTVKDFYIRCALYCIIESTQVLKQYQALRKNMPKPQNILQDSLLTVSPNVYRTSIKRTKKPQKEENTKRKTKIRYGGNFFLCLKKLSQKFSRSLPFTVFKSINLSVFSIQKPSVNCNHFENRARNS